MEEEIKEVLDQMLEMLLRQQAKLQALTECLIKDGTIDLQELTIIESDNLNTLQYELLK